MSTSLKYYIAEILEDLEQASCQEITLNLNLDKWGCVDEKGRHHLEIIIRPIGRLKRPKTIYEELGPITREGNR